MREGLIVHLFDFFLVLFDIRFFIEFRHFECATILSKSALIDLHTIYFRCSFRCHTRSIVFRRKFIAFWGRALFLHIFANIRIQTTVVLKRALSLIV